MNPHFLTKAYFVSHSDKDIVQFKDFCLQCTAMQAVPKKNVTLGILQTCYLKERTEFFTSHSKMFEKTFIALFNMSQDGQHCFNLLQPLKEKKKMQDSVQIETTIEKHDTEKKILRFLIYLNHYHDLICNKSSCKTSDFLNVGNIILLSGLSKVEKIPEFQNTVEITTKIFYVCIFT